MFNGSLNSFCLESYTFYFSSSSHDLYLVNTYTHIVQVLALTKSLFFSPIDKPLRSFRSLSNSSPHQTQRHHRNLTPPAGLWTLCSHLEGFPSSQRFSGICLWKPWDAPLSPPASLFMLLYVFSSLFLRMLRATLTVFPLAGSLNGCKMHSSAMCPQAQPFCPAGPQRPASAGCDPLWFQETRGQ